MQELWKVIGHRKSPRIHVLSDVHLETGPYEIPKDLEFDILIAAGDIGPIEDAVEWLASFGKPVVYVLGNHEYWQHEYGDALALAKAAAKGTKVRVLEREAAVIQGVRFLGATLWTDFGAWNSGLVETAISYMRDYGQITAHRWYAVKSNRSWFHRQCRKIGIDQQTIRQWISEGLFHPAIAYQAHAKTVAWFSRSLLREFAGPTVVVTHHAPSFKSLRESGVPEGQLQPDYWRYPDRSLTRQAAYASRLEPLLKYHAKAIDLWVHGHIHDGFDILTPPTRIICNPRGYALPRFRASWFGYHLSQEDLNAIETRHRQNPFLGDGRGFDRHLVVDLLTGYERPLRFEIEKHLTSLHKIRRDTATLLGHLRRIRPPFRKYLVRCLDQNVREFNGTLDTLMARISPAMDIEPINLITGPHRPYESMCPQSVDAHAQTLACMDGWAAWLSRLPCLAYVRLAEWVNVGMNMLSMLEDNGVSAWVERAPMHLLRRLGMQDHIVVADLAGDDVQLNAWSTRLVDAFSREIPRTHYVSLWHLSDALKQGRCLLTLKDLRRILPLANDCANSAPVSSAGS